MYTVAHELAHVWDHRSSHDLSLGLMQALDTWICDDQGECGWYPYAAHVNEETLEVPYAEAPPGSIIGCFGPPGGSRPQPYAYSTSYFNFGPGWEDCEESFASYVYPNDQPSRVAPGGQRYTGLVQGGIRHEYIEEAIELIR